MLLRPHRPRQTLDHRLERFEKSRSELLWHSQCVWSSSYWHHSDEGHSGSSILYLDLRDLLEQNIQAYQNYKRLQSIRFQNLWSTLAMQ